jgi:hypothetical protein
MSGEPGHDGRGRHAQRWLVASGDDGRFPTVRRAFPLADGWLTLASCGRVVLPPDGAAGRPVLAAGGWWYLGSFCSVWTPSPTLQHGIWEKDANGVIELVINLVTLAPSVVVVRRTRVRRHALGGD